MIHRSKRWVSGPAEILLLLSIVACVLEGTLRKWVFRESAGPIRYGCYFAKDIIFAAIVFCRARAGLNKSLGKVLMVSFPLILTGAGLAAVHELNIVGGLLSFRALVGLPLLTYLIIPRLAGAKIHNVAFLIGGLTVLNALLGITQYSSPADAPINFYATEDLASATAFEENVRAAGTFSYITGYSNLAIVGAWAGLSLLCLARGRLSYIVGGWGAYAASLLCALVSISRGTVLTVLALLVALAISGRHALGNLMKGLATLIVAVAIGYVFNLNSVVVKLSDTVIARHEISDDTIEGRTVGPFLEAGLATEIAPLGSGFGTEQVAGVYAETGVMSMRRFESQFARLVVETGLIGLLGFLMTCVGTLYVFFQVRRTVMDEGLRRVFVLSVFVIASFFFTNVVFNHFASFFTWVIVAITLASASQAGALPAVTSRQHGAATPALSSGMP
jgi:O-antigen ligase